MTDTILDAIRTKTIHAANVSFKVLREVGKKDHNRKSELGWGRAILTTQEQLDQYLHTYGLMTQSQWSQFLGNVTIPSGDIRIVDYGCGQGLACALLFDYFGRSFVNKVKEAVLIEPSAIALARAKAVFECYCGPIAAVAIHKKLDDVTVEDLKSNNGLNTIHLFSNVLDINGFNYRSLFLKMFQTNGKHSVLAVSHDREFDGGSPRFRDINRLVTDPNGQPIFSGAKSLIKQFSCSNGHPAISLQFHLEGLRGPI